MKRSFTLSFDSLDCGDGWIENTCVRVCVCKEKDENLKI